MDSVRIPVYAVLTALFLGFISAESAFSDLGITLSNTCLIQLKANHTTNCPTYEELLLLYPDQSDRTRSGDFTIKDGIYQRDTPQMKNHYEYYRFDENKDRLWIDPPPDVFPHIQTITVTSNDFVYPIRDQVVNDTRIEIGQSRFIDNSCRHGIITANNFVFLMGDTIQHMLLGCEDGTSNFNDIKITQWEKTHHDIATSYKWQLEEWIEEIKENCLTEFMKCKDQRHFKRSMHDGLIISDGTS